MTSSIYKVVKDMPQQTFSSKFLLPSLPKIVILSYLIIDTVLCLGQDFWGTHPYLNFRGTFANSDRHTKSIRFLPVKLNAVFGKFLFNCI